MSSVVTHDAALPSWQVLSALIAAENVEARRGVLQHSVRRAILNQEKKDVGISKSCLPENLRFPRGDVVIAYVYMYLHACFSRSSKLSST